MKTITTESGATYRIDGDRVQRTSANYEKRGDGEWQTLMIDPVITVGEPMVLVMESLVHYGRDDYMTQPEDASPFTTRRTTPVVSVVES